MALVVLLLSCAAIAASETAGPRQFPVIHRPGAMLVFGPEVIPKKGTYRIFIELPSDDFRTELTTMKSFANLTASANATLQFYHQKHDRPPTTSSLVCNSSSSGCLATCLCGSPTP